MKNTFTLLFSWIQLYLTLTPCLAQSRPCPLCSNGPEKIPDRDRLVDPTQGNTLTNTCGFLADSGTGFIQEGTDLCQGIRSAATSCGCNIPPDACLLCWDGSRAPNVDLELVDYPATDLVPVSPPGVLLNCRTLEGALHTMNENDPRCSNIQRDAGERCGCPPFPGSEEEGTATNNETSLAPTETAVTAPVSEDEAEPFEPCPVCAGGERMPLPDKPLTLGGLPIRTCSDLESFTALLVGGSDECRGLQLLGPYCGCAKPPNSCSFCPNGEPVPYKDVQLDFFSDFDPPEEFQSIGNSLSCEVTESITASNPGFLYGLEDSIVCLTTQLRSSRCGCTPDWRQIVLPWCYRISGIFSLLGSTLIVVDVLGRRSGKRFTTYHQLVLGMSFFEYISSVSYVLATVVAPVDSGIYQAKGNDATCTAQGVMIQLGLTSMFYNMFLSIYFWLVICANWKEHQFQKIRVWIHLAICSVGAALAFSSIPYVGPQLVQCGLLIPPGTATLWPAILIFTVPLTCVVLVLSLATGAICWKVYRQQKKAQKWLATRNMELSKKVFWQSFWYVVAFYLTIPWLLIVYYVEFRSSTHALWSNIVVALLSPIQGLLNCLAHFQRQRGWTRCRCCGERKARKKRVELSAAPTSDGPTEGRDSSNVVESTHAIEPYEEDEVGDKEPGEIQEAPGENLEQQSSREDVADLEKEEASQRNDAAPPSEDEFAAVAEYWELNEQDDVGDNVGRRNSLFLRIRRTSLTPFS